MLLLIKYTLLYGIVLMLVALGGMFSEHSGIINIALEGIMVIGALSAGNIVLTTTLNIPMGGEFKPLQDTLDGCFPGILPLIAVLLTWWMLNKKQYSPTKVIIILCVVVAVLCVIGVF